MTQATSGGRPAAVAERGEEGADSRTAGRGESTTAQQHFARRLFVEGGGSGGGGSGDGGGSGSGGYGGRGDAASVEPLRHRLISDGSTELR